MMRQAGRYLPEYRAMRARVDFSTLCRTPSLASEVSLQPIERFGMDACVIFSDILVVVEAMGAVVEYAEGGPRLRSPVSSLADVERLSSSDVVGSLEFVFEALRLTRRALDSRAALVGFVGGPFTLASYLIEGGGSRSFARCKRLLLTEPATMHALLLKLADACAAFAAAQVAAGAQAVQVFDTWAGELAPDAFSEFALPYAERVLARVRAAGAPSVLFVNGCAGKLGSLARCGADVLSLDWRIALSDVRAQIGEGVALQGNVDPCVLLSTPRAVSEAARAAMLQAGPVGHILNLGHGILPETPIECARAFVEAARQAAAA